MDRFEETTGSERVNTHEILFISLPYQFQTYLILLSQ